MPATKLINCGAEITAEISLQAARVSFGFTARIIRFLVVVNLLLSADLMPYWDNFFLFRGFLSI